MGTLRVSFVNIRQKSEENYSFSLWLMFYIERGKKMGNLHVIHNAYSPTPTMLKSIMEDEDRPPLDENETFQSLIDKIGTSSCENNEFIELNKIKMVEIGPMDDQDYHFFWGCMKLYEKYGVNYFSYYLDLRREIFGDFPVGIEQWIKSGNDERKLLAIVNVMRFFGISSYQGISFDEFEHAIAAFPQYEKKVQALIQEENREKAAKTIAYKLDSYFNFAYFDRALFKEYLDYFTVKQAHKKILLNEALKEAKSAPANTYIVILYRDGKACYVGKTEHLLKYIGDKGQKYNADRVFYHVADNEYVDDLIIAIMIYYDLPMRTVRPKRIHRKYATLQQACYAYRYADSLSRKKILAAIEQHHLRTYTIDEKTMLIDKIELEEVLRSGLSRNK